MPRTKCGFDSGPAGSGQDLLVLHGPTLGVDIGFDPSFQPVGTAIPVPAVKAVPALVDTGATISCIDTVLATSLNLPIVDRQKISGASGIKEADMYLAQIHVSALSITIYGSFAGVDLRAGGQVHQALIGRTFLQRFTMIYEGTTGTVTLFN